MTIWLLTMACSETVPPLTSADSEGMPATAASASDSLVTSVEPTWAFGDVLVLLDAKQTGQLQTHATVDWSADGDFLVAWAEDEEPTAVSWVQLYTTDGNAAGDRSQLVAQVPFCNAPDVGFGGGRFVVSCHDNDGGLWLREVMADGAVPAGAAQVQDAYGERETDASDVVVHADGSGVVVWNESLGGLDIGVGSAFWVSYDADLQPVGIAQEIDMSSANTVDGTALNAGSAFLVWGYQDVTDTRPAEVTFELYGATVDPEGHVGSAIRLDDLPVLSRAGRPSVARGPSETLALAFRDKANGGAFVRLLDANGAPAAPSFRLESDGVGDRPVVTWVGDELWAFWEERTNPALGEIRALRMDRQGEPLDVPFIVSEDDGFSHERPSVAVWSDASSYEVIVVWEVRSGGGSRGEGLRGRRVSLQTSE